MRDKTSVLLKAPSRRMPIIVIGLVALAGVILVGQKIYSSKFKTKTISKSTVAEYSPTQSGPIAKAPSVKSKVCDLATAQELQQQIKVPISKASSVFSKSTTDGTAIDECLYEIDQPNNQPVRSITVLSRTYTAKTEAQKYQNQLAQNSHRSQLVRNMADGSFYLPDAHQLIVRRADTVYVITAAVTNPNTNDGRSILIATGKLVLNG